jgi:hypothetical protein
MATPKPTVSLHAIRAREAHADAQGKLARRMSRFSMAEFKAQGHVGDMVDILAGFAMDPTLDVQFRRTCALDVIERADGKVAVKVQMQQVAVDSSGVTIDAEAADAMREAEQLAEAERWISGGLDPSEWPEAVRARFSGEALARLTVIEGDAED